MKIINQAFDLPGFWQSVALANRSILMLDYDGTLAPFVDDPMAAVPYPGVRERLSRIISDDRSRLVMVSGRPLEDLRQLVGINPLPEMWGSHGLEHYDLQGNHSVREFSNQTKQGFEVIREWVEQMGIQRLSEFKLSGAAFHWRPLGPEDAAVLRKQAHERWDNAAGKYGFEVHEFDGGLELRVAGITKANAVKDVLAGAPSGVPAAFLGDDLTDEDGFRALRGRGLSVLVRDEFRETMADVWIVPPEELLSFLDRWSAHAALSA